MTVSATVNMKRQNFLSKIINDSWQIAEVNWNKKSFYLNPSNVRHIIFLCLLLRFAISEYWKLARVNRVIETKPDYVCEWKNWILIEKHFWTYSRVHKNQQRQKINFLRPHELFVANFLLIFSSFDCRLSPSISFI